MKTLSRKRKEQIKEQYSRQFRELLERNFMADNVCTSIYHAYKNLSEHKIRAWQEIRKLQKEYDGSVPIILSHNCFAFTACFAYADENWNTRYKYFTKDYTYDFE